MPTSVLNLHYKLYCLMHLLHKVLSKPLTKRDNKTSVVLRKKVIERQITIMAIQKPRTRLVNIRLSEEEFASLQRATNESGARSISDFCRNAILKSSGGTGQQDLHEVERRLGQLEGTMTQLADRLSAVLPKAQHA